MEIKTMSGKEALKYWIQEAVRRDDNNQSFTDEVFTIFGSIQKVFGAEEASGVLNLVLKTNKTTYGVDANRITFNRAVVKTLAGRGRG
jgi:hypothetical protein